MRDHNSPIFYVIFLLSLNAATFIRASMWYIANNAAAFINFERRLLFEGGA